MAKLKQPIISIITPTYNRAGMLPQAIESVLGQGITDLEYIIIDGNSSDSTREVVSRYPSVTFLSEPDEGLYFALNKGINLAKGRYIGWLNSDDCYRPGALHSALEVLSDNPSLRAVFGAAEVVFRDASKQTVLIPTIQPGEILQRAALDSIPVNSCLIHADVFQQVGVFDTRYKIAADRDFLFRLGMAEIPYGTLQQVQYTFQDHPSSLTFGRRIDTKVLGDLEEMEMAGKYKQLYSDAGEISALCRQWHSRASADAALLSLTQFQVRKFFQFASSGLSQNKKWGVDFVKALLLKSIRAVFPAKTRARYSKYRRYFVHWYNPENQINSSGER